MGEPSTTYRIRARRRIGGAALTAALAVALLSSCAGLRAGGPGGPAAVPDPVAPSAASAPATAPATTGTTAPSAAASAAPSASASASADPRAAVVPFVTSADWDAAARRLDVSALVPDVLESGGTCTLVAERDGTTVTKTGPGVATASYTGCQELSLRDDRLTAGAWQVRVSYASPDSAGTSAARTVTVG